MEKLSDATEIMEFMDKKFHELRESLSWIEDSIVLEGKTGNRVHLARLEASFSALGKALPYLILAHKYVSADPSIDRKAELILDIIEGRVSP